MWSQYTLSNGTFKPQAQMVPLEESHSQEVPLHLKQNGKWQQIPKTTIDSKPVARGIEVHPAHMAHAGASLAILEDREFKSNPDIVTKGTKMRSLRDADVLGATQLGDCQLAVLGTGCAVSLPQRQILAEKPREVASLAHQHGTRLRKDQRAHLPMLEVGPRPVLVQASHDIGPARRADRRRVIMAIQHHPISSQSIHFRRHSHRADLGWRERPNRRHRYLRYALTQAHRGQSCHRQKSSLSVSQHRCPVGVVRNHATHTAILMRRRARHVGCSIIGFSLPRAVTAREGCPYDTRFE